MDKKRKWERDYERYINGELDAEIAKLEKKLIKKPTSKEEYLAQKNNPKTSTKEDYDRYQKLKAIKANLPKVKNILQFREQLDAQIEEIQTEIKQREIKRNLFQRFNAQKSENERRLLVPLEREIENLELQKASYEKEMADLEKEYEALERELSTHGLDANEKDRIKAAIAENRRKRSENNKKFIKCSDDLKEKKKEYRKRVQICNKRDTDAHALYYKKFSSMYNKKFRGIPNKDLEVKLSQLYIDRSRCSIACNRLMQGESWQSVEVALDGYEDRMLKANGEQVKKMNLCKGAAKEEPVQVEPVQKQEDTEQKEPVQKQEDTKQEEPVQKQEDTKQEENSLAVPTRWQRFKRWVQNAYNKITRKESVEEGLEQEVPVQEEPVQEEKQPRPQDAFREYLREVAEKGIDVIENEKRQQMETQKKAERQQMAAQKEAEIGQNVQRMVEARREAAKKVGKPFDEEATKKKARAIAERNYEKEHNPEGMDR